MNLTVDEHRVVVTFEENVSHLSTSYPAQSQASCSFCASQAAPRHIAATTSSVPSGESSMWGDYHARELALMIQREAKGRPYYTFFS